MMDTEKNEPVKVSLDEDKGLTFHNEVISSIQDVDDSIEETDPGKAVWVIACTVSMGGFLFGKCTGLLHYSIIAEQK